MEVKEPPYDGLQSLYDSEARQALADGRYQRAWQMFWRLLQIDPHDLRALRETGRIANALGNFEYSVKALGEVEDEGPSTPDPELHYLRGVSLYALDRKDEAEKEFQWTERDLKTAPLDRRGTLWLARIQVLRGDLKGALALYEPLRQADAPGTATYEEVALYEVEAHILCHDWAGAERSVRAYLHEKPDSERARGLLAWVLEGRQKIDDELVLRKAFADEWTDHPQKTLDYARALERGYDYPEAMDRYREAESLGVEEAADDIERLHYQMTPEVGAGLGLRDDPSGTIQAWTAATSVPMTGRLRVVLSATGETSTGAIMDVDRTTDSASALAVATFGRGNTFAIGPSFRLEDPTHGVGGTTELWTSPLHRLQLQLRGDYEIPWHESASTLRAGGTQDVGTAMLFASTPGRRILFSGGTVVRRLGLSPMDGLDTGHADQAFGVLGVDVTVTQRPERVSRGQIYDGDMITQRSMMQATVLSYRHYEMRSENPFPQRVLLVQSSSVDEVSGSFRHIFGESGILGTELRGGIGYDWSRQMRQWRAGASVMLSATKSSRFTFDYDVANESGNGLAGRRHIGSVVLHVDL